MVTLEVVLAINRFYNSSEEMTKIKDKYALWSRNGNFTSIMRKFTLLYAHSALEAASSFNSSFSAFAIAYVSPHPSSRPTDQPSAQPSTHPSGQPSVQPTSQPSINPGHIVPGIAVNGTATRDTVSVLVLFTTSVLFPGTVYCAAYTSLNASTVRLINSVRIQGYSAAYTTGTTQLLVTIPKLTALTNYTIYCAVQNAIGLVSSEQEIIATQSTVMTACCKLISYASGPNTLINFVTPAYASVEAIYGIYTPMRLVEYQFTYALSAAPRTGSLIVRPVLYYSNGSSVPAEQYTIVPASNTFTSSAALLRGQFLVLPLSGSVKGSLTMNLTLSSVGGDVSEFSLSTSSDRSAGNSSSHVFASIALYGLASDNSTASLPALYASLPKPSLLSARLSDEGHALVISFNIPTNRAGLVYGAIFPCRQLFSFNQADRCQWINSTTVLAVLISANASLSVGDQVQFHGNSSLLVRPDCQDLYVSMGLNCNQLDFADIDQSVTVLVPLSPVVPSIVISAPTHIYTCPALVAQGIVNITSLITASLLESTSKLYDMFPRSKYIVLDASASFGNAGRRWTAVNLTISSPNTAADDSKLATIQEVLTHYAVRYATESGKQAVTVVLPLEMFHKPLTYYLSLTASNFLGRTSTATVVFDVSDTISASNSLSQALYIPRLELTGGSNDRLIKPNDVLSLSSLITLTSCDNTTVAPYATGNVYRYDYAYHWQVYLNNVEQALVSSSPNQRNYKLRGNVLTANAVYVVKLTVLTTVYVRRSNQFYTEFTSSVAVNVFVSSGAVTALISGGSSKTNFVTGNRNLLSNLTIDASSSFDSSHPSVLSGYALSLNSSVFADQDTSHSIVLYFAWSCHVSSAESFGDSCDGLLAYEHDFHYEDHVAVQVSKMNISWRYAVSVTVYSLPYSKALPYASIVNDALLAQVQRFGTTTMTVGIANRTTSSSRRLSHHHSLSLMDTPADTVSVINILDFTRMLNPYQIQTILANIQANAPVSAEWAILMNNVLFNLSSLLSLTDSVDIFQRSFPLSAQLQQGIAYSIAIPYTALSLFLPVSVLTFRLTVSNELGVALASTEISMMMNQAPQSGVFAVNPASGVSMSTLFTLSTNQWTDSNADLPLSYAFHYQVLLAGNASSMTNISLLFGQKLTIQRQGQSNVASAVTLPAGLPEANNSVVLYVTCSDVFGASQTLNQSVTVTGLDSAQRRQSNASQVLADFLSYQLQLSTSLDDDKMVLTLNNVISNMALATPIIGNASLSSNSTTVGRPCNFSADCDTGNCQDALCAWPLKVCENDCQGHGDCSFFTSYHQPLPACQEHDAFCYAKCVCYANYTTADCSLGYADYMARQALRGDVCQQLSAISNRSEASRDTVELLLTSLYAAYHYNLPEVIDSGLVHGEDVAAHAQVKQYCFQALQDIMALVSQGLIAPNYANEDGMLLYTTQTDEHVFHSADHSFAMQHIVELLDDFIVTTYRTNSSHIDQQMSDQITSLLGQLVSGVFVALQDSPRKIVLTSSRSIRLEIQTSLSSAMEQVFSTPLSSTDAEDAAQMDEYYSSEGYEPSTQLFLAGDLSACEQQGYLEFAVGSIYRNVYSQLEGQGGTGGEEVLDEVDYERLGAEAHGNGSAGDYFNSSNTRLAKAYFASPIFYWQTGNMSQDTNASSAPTVSSDEPAFFLRLPFTTMPSFLEASTALKLAYNAYNVTFPSCVQIKHDGLVVQVSQQCDGCAVSSYDNYSVTMACYQTDQLCSSSSAAYQTAYEITSLLQTVSVLMVTDTTVLDPFTPYVTSTHRLYAVAALACLLMLAVLAIICVSRWDYADYVYCRYRLDASHEEAAEIGTAQGQGKKNKGDHQPTARLPTAKAMNLVQLLFQPLFPALEDAAADRKTAINRSRRSPAPADRLRSTTWCFALFFHPLSRLFLPASMVPYAPRSLATKHSTAKRRLRLADYAAQPHMQFSRMDGLLVICQHLLLSFFFTSVLLADSFPSAGQCESHLTEETCLNEQLSWYYRLFTAWAGSVEDGHQHYSHSLCTWAINSTLSNAIRREDVVQCSLQLPDHDDGLFLASFALITMIGVLVANCLLDFLREHGKHVWTSTASVMTVDQQPPSAVPGGIQQVDWEMSDIYRPTLKPAGEYQDNFLRLLRPPPIVLDSSSPRSSRKERSRTVSLDDSDADAEAVWAMDDVSSAEQEAEALLADLVDILSMLLPGNAINSDAAQTTALSGAPRPPRLLHLCAAYNLLVVRDSWLDWSCRLSAWWKAEDKESQLFNHPAALKQILQGRVSSCRATMKRLAVGLDQLQRRVPQPQAQGQGTTSAIAEDALLKHCEDVNLCVLQEFLVEQSPPVMGSSLRRLLRPLHGLHLPAGALSLLSQYDGSLLLPSLALVVYALLWLALAYVTWRWVLQTGSETIYFFLANVLLVWVGDVLIVRSVFSIAVYYLPLFAATAAAGRGHQQDVLRRIALTMQVAAITAGASAATSANPSRRPRPPPAPAISARKLTHVLSPWCRLARTIQRQIFAAEGSATSSNGGGTLIAMSLLNVLCDVDLLAAAAPAQYPRTWYHLLLTWSSYSCTTVCGERIGDMLWQCGVCIGLLAAVWAVYYAITIIAVSSIWWLLGLGLAGGFLVCSCLLPPVRHHPWQWLPWATYRKTPPVSVQQQAQECSRCWGAMNALLSPAAIVLPSPVGVLLACSGHLHRSQRQQLRRLPGRGVPAPLGMLHAHEDDEQSGMQVFTAYPLLPTGPAGSTGDMAVRVPDQVLNMLQGGSSDQHEQLKPWHIVPTPVSSVPKRKLLQLSEPVHYIQHLQQLGSQPQAQAPRLADTYGFLHHQTYDARNAFVRAVYAHAVALLGRTATGATGAGQGSYKANGPVNAETISAVICSLQEQPDTAAVANADVLAMLSDAMELALVSAEDMQHYWQQPTVPLDDQRCCRIGFPAALAIVTAALQVYAPFVSQYAQHSALGREAMDELSCDLYAWCCEQAASQPAGSASAATSHLLDIQQVDGLEGWEDVDNLLSALDDLHHPPHPFVQASSEAHRTAATTADHEGQQGNIIQVSLMDVSAWFEELAVAIAVQYEEKSARQHTKGAAGTGAAAVR